MPSRSRLRPAQSAHTEATRSTSAERPTRRGADSARKEASAASSPAETRSPRLVAPARTEARSPFSSEDIKPPRVVAVPSRRSGSDSRNRTQRGRYYVEALGRGLALLDCFIADPGPHALVELSRQVGLGMPTTLR